MVEQATIEYNMLILFSNVLERKVITCVTWVWELISIPTRWFYTFSVHILYPKFSVTIAVYPELRVSVDMTICGYVLVWGFG